MPLYEFSVVYKEDKVEALRDGIKSFVRRHLTDNNSKLDISDTYLKKAIDYIALNNNNIDFDFYSDIFLKNLVYTILSKDIVKILTEILIQYILIYVKSTGDWDIILKYEDDFIYNRNVLIEADNIEEAKKMLIERECEDLYDIDREVYVYNTKDDYENNKYTSQYITITREEFDEYIEIDDYIKF